MLVMSNAAGAHLTPEFCTSMIPKAQASVSVASMDSLTNDQVSFTSKKAGVIKMGHL